MKRSRPITRVCLFMAATVMLMLAPVAYGGTTLLHEFAGGADDGCEPNGSLTLSGSTLYGMTEFGGDSDFGTLFKINDDGNDFTLLHEFAGGAGDGRVPKYASVIVSGSTLYGMTPRGGDEDRGTVFTFSDGGAGFALLHEFAGGADDGQWPHGGLTLSGSTLYGMTYQGGDSDRGTVFTMNDNGTGFTLLREFTGGADDGQWPRGSLTVSGSTLYGMTMYGGDSNSGTIFKMDDDGKNFALLREFAGGAGDGSYPYGNLTLSGSTLYGMTENGGNSNHGTIFKINDDGNGFTVLHEFAGGAGDGSYPYGNLTLSGSMLYGMTHWGGDTNEGTIFTINADGSGFALLHEFAGGGDDGRKPYGSLTLSGSTLYGMTNQGGDNDDGTVFSLEIEPIPEPVSIIFFGTGLVGLVGYVSRRRMRK